MIVVRLTGGLGNQMFQYAFGRMLSLKNKTVLKLDTTLLLDRTPMPNAVFRDYELDIFNISPVFAAKKEIEYFNGYPNGTLFERAGFKISKIIRPRNLVVQKQHEYSDIQLQIDDNSCIVGRWQSEKYFKGISNLISNDFSIKKSYLLNSVYCQIIKESTSSVAIHVRRGDYVSNDLYRKNIGALDIMYYKNAISYLDAQINDASYFVFSDDIEWCRSNFNFLSKVIFVDTEKSKKGMAEDLKLITLCKHHIISNSTFSWWGAHLVENEKRIVIAPQKWTLNNEFEPPFIIPENWKKI